MTCVTLLKKPMVEFQAIPFVCTSADWRNGYIAGELRVRSSHLPISFAPGAFARTIHHWRGSDARRIPVLDDEGHKIGAALAAAEEPARLSVFLHLDMAAKWCRDWGGLMRAGWVPPELGVNYRVIAYATELHQVELLSFEIGVTLPRGRDKFARFLRQMTSVDFLNSS